MFRTIGDRLKFSSLFWSFLILEEMRLSLMMFSFVSKRFKLSSAPKLMDTTPITTFEALQGKFLPTKISFQTVSKFEEPEQNLSVGGARVVANRMIPVVQDGIDVMMNPTEGHLLHMVVYEAVKEASKIDPNKSFTTRPNGFLTCSYFSALNDEEIDEDSFPSDGIGQVLIRDKGTERTRMVIHVRNPLSPALRVTPAYCQLYSEMVATYKLNSMKVINYNDTVYGALTDGYNWSFARLQRLPAEQGDSEARLHIEPLEETLCLLTRDSALPTTQTIKCIQYLMFMMHEKVLRKLSSRPQAAPTPVSESPAGGATSGAI